MTANRVRTKPRPYQRKDVRRAWVKFGGRALFAHSPGLGKTPMALWGVKKYMRPGNVVVVVQANLKINWAREALKHIGRKVVILSGRKPTKFPSPPPKNQIFVVNYDILGRPGKDQDNWLNWLKKTKPRCVILDEAQMIRSRTAIRTKASRELCLGVPHVLALGGTGALENCPADLFPVLNILRPDKWDSFWTYARDHCNPKKTRFGWEFKGASRLPKLHKRLKRYVMVRRRKEDVLKDLPPITRIVTPVQLAPHDAAEYAEAEMDFVKWLNKNWWGAKNKSKLNPHRLAHMTYLKRLAGHLKLDFFKQWIADWLADNPGKKALAFGWHTEFLSELHGEFPNSVLVTGKVPVPKRQPMMDKFNFDPSCRLFFGNLQAGGVGWSCVSASTTLMLEKAWNPAVMNQASGRNHPPPDRGVVGEPNFEFWFPAIGTIEEKLLNVLQKKQSIQDAVLDGLGKGLSTLDVHDVYEEITKLYRKEK